MNDPIIQAFSKKIFGNIETAQGRAMLLNIFPFLPKILPEFIIDNFFGMEKVKSSRDELSNFIMVSKRLICIIQCCFLIYINYYLIDKLR